MTLRTGVSASPAERNRTSRLQIRLRWQKIVQSGRPASLRIAILATFTADPLVPYMGVALEESGLPSIIQQGPYNQIIQQCLSEDSQVARFQPDILVVCARLEELWSGRPTPLYGDVAATYTEDFLQLANACVKAAASWNARLVFVLPAVPEIRPLGIGDENNYEGVFATATRVREVLRRSLVDKPGVALVDLEVVIRTIGSSKSYNHPLFAVARIPFSEEAFAQLGQHIALAIKLSSHPARKVVVIDADDVLWQGRLEQKSSASADYADSSPEECSLNLQYYLLDLRRAGVLLALQSRSQEECVWHFFEQEGVPLRASYFCAWRINRQPSALNVATMADELALSADLFAFLSRDSSGLKELQAALPSVGAIMLPEDPAQWLVEIQDSSVLDRLPSRLNKNEEKTLVEKDGQRSSQVREEALTLDDFLTSLNLHVTFSQLKPPQIERVADLTRRTVEFNLLPGEQSEEEIEEQLTSGRMEFLGIHVSDRFGDYGLAGVVAFKTQGNILKVECFLLVCPILGKNVENRVIAHLLQLAGERHCSHLLFSYRPTPRNGPALEFLRKIGSQSLQAQDDGRFTLMLPVEFSPPSSARSNKPSPGNSTASSSTIFLAYANDFLATHHAFASANKSKIVNRIAARCQTGIQILEIIRRQRRVHPVIKSDFLAPRTPIEKRLSEIWAEILNREQVGIHEDFFQIGGDSLLAIQVSSRCIQADLQIVPKMLFEHRTIARLGALVSSVTAIQAEQGVVTGMVPLTPAQHWFFDRIAGALSIPDYFNYSTYLELQQDLTFSLLERALQHLLAHHDSLRLYFVRTSSGWQQFNAGIDKKLPFFCVDVSALASVEQEAVCESVATRLQASLNLAEGPPMRAVLFDLGPQKLNRLLLIHHHLVIDGFSQQTLIEDLHTLCMQLASNKATQLPPKTTSYKQWAERLIKYAQTVEPRQELSYWQSSLGKDTCIPVDYPEGTYTYGSVDHVEMLFNAEDARLLLHNVPRAYRTHRSTVLLAAFTQTLMQWTGEESLRVAIAHHGREAIFDDVDISRTVGWFQSYFPILLNLEKNFPLPDALKSIDVQLRHVPNGGRGYGLLRYLCQDAEIVKAFLAIPEPQIGFDYMGNLGGDKISSEMRLFKMAQQFPGPEQDVSGCWPHLLDAFVSATSDQLRVRLTYSANVHRRSTIEKLARSFKDKLQSLLPSVSEDLFQGI